MIHLSNSLQAWNTGEFKSSFIKEVEQLDGRELPLQAGLSLSSYALFDDFKVVVLKMGEDADTIQIKTGIFYTGIISGCSCADDPTPLDEQNEYCEVLFTINKLSGVVEIALLES